MKYQISGITMQSALEREIEIDTTTIFESEDDINLYIKSLEQKFANTRNFDSVEITYEIISEEENFRLLELQIKTTDSFHFLLLPWGKFSSSSGLKIEIKAKDSNFLGTMNDLNTSLAFTAKPDDDGNQFKIFEPEINFSYDYPFHAGIFDLTWTNDFSIWYTFGNGLKNTSPEWTAKTGLSLKYKIKDFSTINLSFVQGFYKDLDYKNYGDDTYLKETLSAYLPIKILDVPSWSSLYFSPAISVSYNWDPFNWNGKYSGFVHNDLQSPIISTSASFSIGNENWSKNYRNGLSVSFTPHASYNIASHWIPSITRYGLGLSLNAKAFKSFEYIGFCSRFWASANIYDVKNPKISGTNRADSWVRGVISDRKSSYNNGYYQGDTPILLAFNFDMPFTLFKTDWQNFPITKKIKFMRYFNFEMQLSPFFDFALIQTTNERQGYVRTFDFRDGFYGAGFEILLYPQKWSSYVIRASFGFDLSRTLFKTLVVNSWRDNSISVMELSIGLGLQY